MPMDLPPKMEKTVEDPTNQALNYLKSTLKYLGDESKVHEYTQATKDLTDFEIKVDQQTLNNLKYAAEKMGFSGDHLHAYQSDSEKFEKIFRAAQGGAASL